MQSFRDVYSVLVESKFDLSPELCNMTGLDLAVDIVLKSWVFPMFPLNDLMVDNCATELGDVGVGSPSFAE